MTCHPVSNFDERQSLREEVRLFTCRVCGKKWAYSEGGGWYQQGRKMLTTEPLTRVVRVTEAEYAKIQKGRFAYKHNRGNHE